MAAPRPSDDELKAYHQGLLDDQRFAEVDAWLSQQEDEGAELDDESLASIGDQVHNPHIPLAIRQQLTIPDDTVLFIPQHLQQRFQLQQNLGRGGMGTVDAVWDRLLDRPVAIKRCRPRKPDESPQAFADRVSRFRREARLTASLEHPGVVPIHDIGNDAGGAPAYVMKRIEGVSLSNHLQSVGGSVSQAVRVIMRVAETIAYAHDQGIVHRDLTPDNIVIGTFGNVAVIDWGLAARTGDPQAGGCGTPGWAPPEQLRGDPPDPRMDVWGLAALLCYACTGTPPYPAGKAADLTRPSTIIDVRGQMPPALSALVRHCLSIDPQRRCADGSTFVAELQRWLSEGLTQAQQPGIHQRIVAFTRRHVSLVIACGCFLALLVAIGWALIMSVREQQRLDRIRITRVMAEIPFSDNETLRLLANELDDVEAGMGRDSTELQTAREALQKAQDYFRRQHERDHLLALFAQHEMRYRRRGPWVDELDQRLQLLRRSGLKLTPESFHHDVSMLREHELRDRMLTTLIQVRRAQIVDKQEGAQEIFQVVHRLLYHSRLDDAWSHVVNMVLQGTASAGGVHMRLPQVGVSDSLREIRQDHRAIDILLAIFAPDEQLQELAYDRFEHGHGAFWPRVTISRIAMERGDLHQAREHALVAFGADDKSMWPPLLLSFIALEANEPERALLWAKRGEEHAPENIYLITLHAAALAALDRRDEAQELIDVPGLAGHYHYHLKQDSPTLLSRCVQILQAAGVVIPEAPPMRIPTLVPRSETP